MRVLVGLVVLADFVRFEIVGISRSLMDSIGFRGFGCFYVLRIMDLGCGGDVGRFVLFACSLVFSQ